MGSAPGKRGMDGHLLHSGARSAKEGSVPQGSTWQALEASLLPPLQVPLHAAISAKRLYQQERH